MQTDKKTFQPQEFLQGTNIAPYVLFLGAGFDINMPDNKKIFGLPWNCIITSLSDDNALNILLDNENRKTRNVSAEEVCDRKANYRDRRNLKIVHLFDSNDAQANHTRRMQIQAKKCLGKVIQSIGAQTVRLVVLGYGKADPFELGSMLDSLADGDILRNVKSLFFASDVQNDLSAFIDEDENSRQMVELYSDTLSHLLCDLLENEQFTEDDFLHENTDDYVFFAGGKIRKLGRREYLNKYRFIHLLHEKELGNSVPPFLIQNYFYAFLKQSPYEPQWYGYHEKNKFFLERDTDTEIYEKCKKYLEKPGDLNQKPIVLVGNSGTGKSIAVARVAYRIFQEHKYPVIFQNKMSLVQNDDESWISSLDELLRFLESSGAPSVLIVMDQSVAGDLERDNLVRLFRKLRNRGRNITMLFTAYSVEDTKGPDSTKKSCVSDKENFDSVLMSPQLSSAEEERLQTLLKRKAKISREEIDELLIDAKRRDDFLAFLYYTFRDLRKPLIEGVYEQFRRTIQAVINQKDKQDDIKELLISVAIASQFKLGFPCNLAYRMVHTLSDDTIYAIARIPSFRYSSTEDGDYTFYMRTPLEADMLLQYFNMTPNMKVDYIGKMITRLRAEKDETAFMIPLLRYIGPNAPAIYAKDAKGYRDYDEEIIESLKIFREETRGDLGMTLQEITYIRERANRLRDNEGISADEYADELIKAIDIGDEAVKPLRINVARNRTVASLLVEMSNSRINLYILDSARYNQGFLDQAQDDLREVISTNPGRDNIAYAYTVLLKALKAEIDNKDTADTKKLELLAKGYDLIKLVENENRNVYENGHFYFWAQDIIGDFENQELSDDMFDDMIVHHKATGIYCRASKQLRNLGIAPYKKQLVRLTDEQVSACQKICDELLDNTEYKTTTDLAVNPECQRLLLHLVWLMYDRYPLFCEERHLTGIKPEGWLRLKEICERNYKIYCSGSKELQDYYKCHRFLYILALCHAQLSEPEECQKIIRIIRRETDAWEYNEPRIVVQHIICDENRIPKSDFSGEVLNDVTSGSGYIHITGWPGGFGKKGIYFHERNLNGLRVRKGDFYKDFQLGIGYMGLAVFHGLKGDRKDG